MRFLELAWYFVHVENDDDFSVVVCLLITGDEAVSKDAGHFSSDALMPVGSNGKPDMPELFVVSYDHHKLI